MKAYLDASLVISLFLIDAHSVRARTLLADEPSPVLADWCAVEVSSVVARQMRMGGLSAHEAQAVYANFDRWRESFANEAATAMDMAAAMQFVRRADLTLRGPDALHLAIVSRLGAKLLTFDARLAAAARSLNVSVVIE